MAYYYSLDEYTSVERSITFMMSRLLAIVAAIMLLGGAAVGILALRPVPADGQGKVMQAIADVHITAPENPTLAPIYDIPRLDKISIDGSPADWGTHGLHVNLLANTSNKVQPKRDIDATLRLGWNERGLLALVNVTDDIDLEDADPAAGDSVEMFLSPHVGSLEVIRIAISPGMDAKQPRLRTRVFDLRSDPQLKKTAPRISAARTKVDGGYALEALIPWAGLGIKPQIGQEVGFQLQINDVDAFEQVSHLVWFPSTLTAKDPSKMQRLRLGSGPSPAVQVAAYGDYPRFHRTRVNVVADATLAGKTVEIARRDLPQQPAEPHILATGKLELNFVRSEFASINLSLPMPARGIGYGTLDVLIDGKRMGIVDLPDPGNAARWVMPYEEFVFKPCIFSTRAFPEGDFTDPSYAEDLVGSYETKITFYDASYNVVTTAEKPGRYGAVVEVHTDEGHTFKRFRTLFRESQDFSWRNTDIPFTVKLPKEMGISSDAMKVQQQSVSTYFKELLKDEGVNRDSDTAVLLAGLFETKNGDKSLLSNSPAAMDRAWWAGLKRKIGEPVITHLTYLPPTYEANPAQRWPLVLFLHGKGERGDNISQIKEAALPSRLEYDHGFRAQFPAIVVAPQCPAGEWWSNHELAAVLDVVQAKYRVDPDRVYVTGMSMGGYGTWALATEFPDRFAAIAPICGGGDMAEAARLAHLPIWAFHGHNDNVVPFEESERMVDALHKLGGDIRFTAYRECGHDAWTSAYSDPELFAWMFSHTRKSSTANRSPLVAAAGRPTTMPSAASR